MHLMFWNFHSLKQHHEFLAGKGWKCNILKWNQLFLKEEGLYYIFPSKIIFDIFHFFSYFGLYFPFCDWQHGTFLCGRPHTSNLRTILLSVLHLYKSHLCSKFHAFLSASSKIYRLQFSEYTFHCFQGANFSLIFFFSRCDGDFTFPVPHPKVD